MELKELVGEEIFKQIENKLNGHSVIIADKDEKYVKDDGKLIPKYRFDELIEQKNTYKESNEELNKQIALLKEKSKGNEEVQTQLQKLQDELKDRDNKVNYITKEFALKDSLRSAGVRYPDLVMATFDIDSIELDGDKIKGWDEALTDLKKEYPDLFSKPKIPGTDNGGSSEPPVVQLSAQQKKEAREKFAHLSQEKAEEAWYEVLLKTGKIKKG